MKKDAAAGTTNVLLINGETFCDAMKLDDTLLNIVSFDKKEAIRAMDALDFIYNVHLGTRKICPSARDSTLLFLFLIESSV